MVLFFGGEGMVVVGFVEVVGGLVVGDGFVFFFLCVGDVGENVVFGGVGELIYFVVGVEDDEFVGFVEVEVLIVVDEGVVVVGGFVDILVEEVGGVVLVE